MIVTKHFVFIHTSRSAGTFLNKLILENVPGAEMLQYHGHLRDLPGEFSHLPVIGFVRNPWDWYVSMCFDYQRKKQYVFEIISNRGALDFKATVARFLKLGDNSDQSRKLLEQLIETAPTSINVRKPARRELPGLRSEHFANYPDNLGYYSWLFKLMYESETDHRIHIGRFENLREEALRLFELTGTPITKSISAYLKDAKVLNSSSRPYSYINGYGSELEQLVAEKDKYLIDQFEYVFSEANKYPKTDYFNHLGSADVDALIERVKNIPDSLWISEDENKPNKFALLNDTCHVIFRFLSSRDNVFDSSDHPVLWDEWKDVLLPIMEQAARRLGYENYRFPRVMLARLPAGGEISGHSDGDASYYIHKIHVPLITNPETIFHVGEQSKHLPVGEIIEVNNKRIHAVKNDGEHDRIHLIFECYNMDDYGKLTDTKLRLREKPRSLHQEGLNSVAGIDNSGTLVS